MKVQDTEIPPASSKRGHGHVRGNRGHPLYMTTFATKVSK